VSVDGLALLRNSHLGLSLHHLRMYLLLALEEVFWRRFVPGLFGDLFFFDNLRWQQGGPPAGALDVLLLYFEALIMGEILFVEDLTVEVFQEVAPVVVNLGTRAPLEFLDLEGGDVVWDAADPADVALLAAEVVGRQSTHGFRSVASGVVALGFLHSSDLERGSVRSV